MVAVAVIICFVSSFHIGITAIFGQINPELAYFISEIFERERDGTETGRAI